MSLRDFFRIKLIWDLFDGFAASSIRLRDVIIGAIIAVNPVGDVIDPKTGKMIAGMRSRLTLTWMKRGRTRSTIRSNTVIRVIATNARLTKAQATRVAQMAQDGLAQTIRPAHTMYDGDGLFALSTGKQQADVSTVGVFAAEVVAEAIIRAVQAAQPAGGLPGLNRSK